MLGWLTNARTKARMTKGIERLELFNRRLYVQGKKLERRAEEERARAKRDIVEGREKAAKLRVKHYLSYTKWDDNLEVYRLMVDQLTMRLKNASDIMEFRNTLAGLKQVFKYVKNIPVDSIGLQGFDEVDVHLKSMEDVVTDAVEDAGFSDEINDEAVNKMLDEMREEVGVELKEKGLRTPPVGVAPVRDDVSDKDVEAELSRLEKLRKGE